MKANCNINKHCEYCGLLYENKFTHNRHENEQWTIKEVHLKVQYKCDKCKKKLHKKIQFKKTQVQK